MAQHMTSTMLEQRYWRIIRWLSKPKGQVLWELMVSLLVTTLALFQNDPPAYIVVMLVIFLSKAWIEYSWDRLNQNTKLTHSRRVRDNLRPYLKHIKLCLTNIGSENFQFAIMCPDYEGKNWSCSAHYDMLAAKIQVSFSENKLAWLASAKMPDAQPLATNLTEKSKIDYLQDPLIIAAFDDIASVLVAPLYKPNSPSYSQHLLGILVVYSDEGANSILVAASTSERCRKEVKKISTRIASILCYDCICTDEA